MGPFDPPYDWHFDRDHDGKLDFDEEYERQDFDDWLNHRGIYEEKKTDDEDDDWDGDGDGLDDDEW